jgi:YcxB-like protein
MELHLEFTVKARDIFRATIGLAKVRIFVGLAITLCLITGLVLFFLKIDEQRILIQTSPLFIAMPLLAVGGQVLRLHATCRKYVASLSPRQRLMQYAISENSGIEIRSGDSFGSLGWGDVMKVVERRGYFLVYVNKYDIRVIPKRTLTDPKELNLLRGILASKIGSRAKLMSPPVN